MCVQQGSKLLGQWAAAAPLVVVGAIAEVPADPLDDECEVPLRLEGVIRTVEELVDGGDTTTKGRSRMIGRSTAEPIRCSSNTPHRVQQPDRRFSQCAERPVERAGGAHRIFFRQLYHAGTEQRRAVGVRCPVGVPARPLRLGQATVFQVVNHKA